MIEDLKLKIKVFKEVYPRKWGKFSKLNESELREAADQIFKRKPRDIFELEIVLLFSSFFPGLDERMNTVVSAAIS